MEPAVLETGEGMGMTKWQIFTKVRLPLALDAMAAGIHIAIISTIGIATIGATIGAGGTYTLEIEPNQNWEVSVPTATAAWFWIQDETQKVWTLRGGAGASRIVIGVAELDEFDDTRVCEVTLKMGGQSKVIATITRGTLERGFSLRTCKLDQYGDFEYGGSETGLTYSYNEGEAESIDLTWPEGRTDFSMPILRPTTTGRSTSCRSGYPPRR